MTHTLTLRAAIAATMIVGGIAMAQVNRDVPASRVNAVPGEKLDSGLGELPPYHQWADPSGRAPVMARKSEPVKMRSEQPAGRGGIALAPSGPGHDQRR